MGKKLEGLIGKKFSMLLILEELPPVDNMRKFRVKCDCGNLKEMFLANITRATGCGCQKRKLPFGVSERNRVLRSYKKNAQRRGLEWSLSEEDFDSLTNARCHYCGCLPANISYWKYSRSNGSFAYNGIDRMDNDKGYFKGNVCPCCKTCNYLKKGLSYSEFVGFIARLRVEEKTRIEERIYKSAWHLLIASVGLFELKKGQSKISKILSCGLIAFHADAAVCDALDIPTTPQRFLRRLRPNADRPAD